jgi:uncharacterized metal-binding protein YceD (DUF177 family)
MDKRDFVLNIYNLDCKSYEYKFGIKSAFFEWFDDPMIQKGELEVWVELDKTETKIELDFQIDGTIELECDRSLDKFQHPLHLREHLIYKFGEEEAELTEEVFVIKADTQQLDISRPIFEFIRVAVPMKKLHPRYTQGFEDEDEEDEIIYRSGDTEDSKQEIKEVDPRWQALKDLKNKE